LLVIAYAISDQRSVAIATAAAAAAAATAAAATAAAAAEATTATAAAAAAEATTAAAAGSALLRLVHAERAAVEHRAVQASDRVGGRLLGAHGDEREPARLAGLAIHRHRDLAHLADGGEGITNGVLRGAEREIADVETITHDTMPYGFLLRVRAESRPSDEAVSR
jgi:hypothetical protein